MWAGKQRKHRAMEFWRGTTIQRAIPVECVKRGKSPMSELKVVVYRYNDDPLSEERETDLYGEVLVACRGVNVTSSSAI